MDDDRQRILGTLWADIRGLTVENVQNYPAAARAISAGADPTDVARAMTAAAYEATFNALSLLTGEEDLQELAASGAALGLHEDLLSADPNGDEGRDLFT
ncbi:hypothetical protein [Intrasporangium sp. YIM S08009]|uniref:hypothetical protein n=1 Tax=Intrasporangium zincisolvens TaxID=3080018 RepID=UPI002B05E999|nr:hypothetical protein [Intrasporangium sp. YIM S08009]